MADELCIHCREPHASTSAFCPNTGKPMRPLAAAARGDAEPGATATASPPVHSSSPSSSPSSPPPPPPQATAARSPAATAAGAPPPPRASANLPSWVTNPEGPPPLEAGVILEEDGDTGVFDLLQRAFGLYRKNAKLLITVAAVVFVPGALAHACARAVILAPTLAISAAIDPVTHLPVSEPHAAGLLVAGFSAVMLGLLAAAVTGLFLHGIIVPLAQGALAIATADRIAGGTAGWREIWTWLFRRLGTVLSAIIPAALLVGAGFFFLVVPGLLLAFFFAFVPTVALFEGLKGTDALRRSYTLVRSDWLRMLLVLLVFGVISAVAQFVAGLLPVGLFGTRLLQDALTLVALPIPVIGSVLLYFDVRRKHDQGGYGTQQLAEEMARLRNG